MGTFKQRKRSKTYIENVIKKIKDQKLDHFFHCYFKNRLGVELFPQFSESDIYYSKAQDIIGIPLEVYRLQFKEIFEVPEPYEFNFYEILYDIDGTEFTIKDFFNGSLDRQYLSFIHMAEQGIVSETNRIGYEYLEEDDLEHKFSFYTFDKDQQLTPFVYRSYQNGDSYFPYAINFRYRDIIIDFELFKNSPLIPKIGQINNFKLLMRDEYDAKMKKIHSLSHETCKMVAIDQFIIDSKVFEIFQKINDLDSKYLLIQDWLYQFYFNMCVLFTATMDMENFDVFAELRTTMIGFLDDLELYIANNPYLKPGCMVRGSFLENMDSKDPLLITAAGLIQKINCYESFRKELLQCVNQDEMKKFIFKHTLPETSEIASRVAYKYESEIKSEFEYSMKSLKALDLADEIGSERASEFIDEIESRFKTNSIKENAHHIEYKVALVMEHARRAMIEQNTVDLKNECSSLVKSAKAELENKNSKRYPEVKKVPEENSIKMWIEEYQIAVQNDPMIIEILKNKEIESSEDYVDRSPPQSEVTMPEDRIREKDIVSKAIELKKQNKTNRYIYSYMRRWLLDKEKFTEISFKENFGFGISEQSSFDRILSKKIAKFHQGYYDQE